jgi:hypothetical protein
VADFTSFVRGWLMRVQDMSRSMKPTFLFFSGLLALWCSTGFANGATEDKTMRVETRFGRGEWNADEWIFVKSPRWSYVGAWVQEDDHIRNRTPEGVGEDQLIADRYFSLT